MKYFQLADKPLANFLNLFLCLSDCCLERKMVFSNLMKSNLDERAYTKEVNYKAPVSLAR